MPGDDSKTQMVVRAETNLGNILLNIILSDKMQFVQRGNNVQVCVQVSGRNFFPNAIKQHASRARQKVVEEQVDIPRNHVHTFPKLWGI